MSRRYAIYYAPPEGSALESFGRAWIGRDHVTGAGVVRPEVAGVAPEQLDEITAFPRTYGFHATLKAPFALAEGTTAADLHDAARDFAATRPPFIGPRLEVTALSAFIALTLAAPCPEMDALAADCVRVFERFRAPLTEDDLARRRAGRLSPRQDAHLVRFGYPYVFEDFHFHMTLTGPLDAPQREAMLAVLRELAALVVATPLEVAEIAVYE